ncbi:MAG TPA: aminoglycoside phosphotransferase family protein [Allosphingosinicella sp.]|nr:aminoglycoside phosphotransferase family protein [Allosphingosinicella sp.]
MEPARAALKLDVDLVRRLLGSQFPQWSSLPIRPILPGGWDNRTFRLGDDMVVRLPSAAVYSPQVEKEHRWLPILRPLLPLPIPAPIGLGQPCHGYPWSWSIYKWLPGKAASTRQVSLSHRLARSLGSFLAALQNIDASGGPSPGPDNFHRGGSLQVYDAETRRAVALLGAKIDARVALRIWDEALAAPHDGHPVWLHGDVSAGNLLVEGGALAGVIDFGCSAVGDPACDLAVAWSSMERQTRQAFRTAVNLPDSDWARARGWALWKALVVTAGISPAHSVAESQNRVALEKVLLDA